MTSGRGNVLPFACRRKLIHSTNLSIPRDGKGKYGKYFSRIFHSLLFIGSVIISKKVIRVTKCNSCLNSPLWAYNQSDSVEYMPGLSFPERDFCTIRNESKQKE